MSFESMAMVWAHSQATGSALLAALAIADHDGDGGAWPSMETIAARARVTRDAARKLVRKLEEMGEIVTDKNAGGGIRTAAHMRTNRYEITIECPPECDHSVRHRIRTEPVDNTPQPNGGDPAARRGTPQPNGGANPTLTSHLGNSDSKARAISANPEVSNLESNADDYTDWNPADKIAAARKRMVEAKDQPTPVKRYTAPPAPHVPRFDPSTLPPKPEPVGEQQQIVNAQAEQLVCPEGFGDGKHARHWIPPTMTGCCRCGAEAQDILTEAIQMEIPQ